MEDTTLNKEQVYDQQIAPLMTQIIDICQQRGISMVATFALPIPGNDDLACTTALQDENGDYSPLCRNIVRLIAQNSDIAERAAERETTH